MKKLLYLTFLSLSVVLCSCVGQPSAKQTAIKTDDTTNMIKVIYFHAEHRCQACLNIEKYTKYTLETYFPEQLKEGKITFQTINVDEKGNYAIAEDYQAGGSALFLDVINKGESNRINMTDFAFLNSPDKKKFTRDLKAEISNELKNL